MRVARVVPIAMISVLPLIGLGACSSSQDAPSQDVTTSSAPPQSTSDDWYAAVCKPGTFADGQGANGLPNADEGTAFCSAPDTYSSAGTLIFIGVYSSDFKLENDVTLLNGPYATTTTSEGNSIVFALLQGGRADALDPLVQYGFELHEGAT